MTVTTQAIELVNVSRRFGDVMAVDHVSLTVAPGEVVGLLGPNGAGKTTALRVLAGLLTPSSGTARIGGIDVQQNPVAARMQLGFLTSSTGLYERLTGRDILKTFGALHELQSQALRQRIDQVIEELELGAFIDRRCGALSSGQKQRISIARAVVHDPAVYVLDEPTATLDPVAAQDILDLVRRAQAHGKAVLFSTHRLDEAEMLCNRVVVIRKGKVVSEGTVAQLKAGHESITAAFLQLVA